MMTKSYPVADAMPPVLNVWLAEDDDEVRTLLTELVDGEENFQCARQFCSAESLLAALALESPPDIILLDINMGGMTGIDAIEPIKRLAGATRVFIMTTFYDSIKASRARAVGAAGFFVKIGEWEHTVARLRNPALDWVPVKPVRVPIAWEAEKEEVRAEITAKSGWNAGVERPVKTKKTGLGFRAWFPRLASIRLQTLIGQFLH